MFSARLFVGLLIPLVLLGCCLYFVTGGLNKNDVRVAGELIAAEEVNATVNRCELIQDQGTRTLVIELEVLNEGQGELDIKPAEFQVVLALKENSLGNSGQTVFEPLSSSSYCSGAPGSQSVIPPNTSRSYTLNYWAQTFPKGSEWDDYFLNLECYSTQSSFLLSKLLTVSGE
jgi:hypothetical protein